MTNRPETPHPMLAAFRGDQFKPTVILLVSPLLMLTWHYFGAPDAWGEPASGAVYSFLACLLLLGVVPVLIVKLAFRERLADYGVRWGNRRLTVRSFLLLAPACVLAAYLASCDPATREVYPINKSAGSSPVAFALHAGTYLLFYAGWEFHFRGFLQFGLRDKLGAANALLVQVMASGLLHIGKSGVEAFAAIGGGILWGVVAYRTRSLLSGLLQHFLLGIALDWFICYL